MKEHDATEAAYRNGYGIGFGVCLEMMRRFRPGDSVYIHTLSGKKPGTVLDWVVRASAQGIPYKDILYIVKTGDADDSMTKTVEAKDIEMISRPSFEDGFPAPALCELREAGERRRHIPYVLLHKDEDGGDIFVGEELIRFFEDGVVHTSREELCVRESAADIMEKIRKAREKE